MEGIQLVRLALVTFFLFSASAGISICFPLYFQFRGLSHSEIGVVVGWGALVSIFAPPFWGVVSDRNKTIKKVIVLLVGAGVLLTIPLFMSHTMLSIMLSLGLFMFFVSAATPLLESLLVKYANDNKVNYGAIRLWGEVGVGTTTLVIGFVLQYYGMRYLGWMYGLLLLGGLLLLLRTPDAQREAKPITMQSFAKLFSNRTFLLYLIIILLVSIPHRMNDSYLMIYLAQLGATGTIAGLGWTVSATGSMISLLFLSKLMDKYDEIRFVIIACICYAIRWLIYGLAEHSGFVIAGQALHMATFSVFLVASTRYIYRIVPKELIATAITLYLAIFMGLGGIIGGVAGGWMIDHTGPHAAYLLGCMLSAAAAGLAIAYRSRLIKE